METTETIGEPGAVAASRRGAALALSTGIVGLVLAIGYLWFVAQYDPDVAFLPRTSTGKWIVFPSSMWLGPKRSDGFSTTYRRALVVAATPRRATLSWRAFRQARLLVNGIEVNLPVPPGDRWKVEQTVDLPPLHNGENQLVVEVTNPDGPGALWADVAVDDTHVVTDEQWRVTYAGSLEVDAVAADALRPPHPQSDDWRPPTPWEALTSQAGLLAGLVAAVLIVTWNLTSGPQPAHRSWLHSAALLWLGGSILWGGIFLNNVWRIPAEMGFDADDHLDYVRYVLDHGRLPLARDGAEMHQPPLFYVTCAAIVAAAGHSLDTETGLRVARHWPRALGLLHFALVFATLRQLFPGQTRPTVFGLLIALGLPVHLFIFQYVTNEAAVACASAAALYGAVRLLTAETAGWRSGLLLGLGLGAAMLSKVTAIVLLPAVVAANVLRLILARRWTFRDWGATVALPLVVCGAVSGWHYARNWWHFGTPLARQIDVAELDASQFWKDPGYRTSQDFLRFGSVLRAPFFAGFQSVNDALYSTFWGDGRCGGRGAIERRTPWNYRLMSAGYLTCLIPAVFVLAGFVATVVRFSRRPEPIDALLLLALACMALALAFECLVHAYITVTKAWYTMPVVVPFIALASRGVELVARRGRLATSICVALLGTWSLASCLAFSVIGDAEETLAAGIDTVFDTALDLKQWKQADQLARDGLKLRPDSALIYYRLGEICAATHRPDEALDAFQRALRLRPGWPPAQRELARGLRLRGELDGAERYARDALRANSHPENALVLSDILARQARFSEAEEVLRRSLIVDPYEPHVYVELARLALATDDLNRASQCAQWARQVGGPRERYQLMVAECLIAKGQWLEALELYRQLQPPDTFRCEVRLAEAWLLATADDEFVDAGRAQVLFDSALPYVDPNRLDVRRVEAAVAAAHGAYRRAQEVVDAAIASAREGRALWYPTQRQLAADQANYQQERRASARLRSAEPPVAP
ncbi:MAG: tetratricopeptide repeat protein [Pirellulales bacterium]|nr:tetratricopeptide repeat protein [Pirellulales bacterium]